MLLNPPAIHYNFNDGEPFLDSDEAIRHLGQRFGLSKNPETSTLNLPSELLDSLITKAKSEGVAIEDLLATLCLMLMFGPQKALASYGVFFPTGHREDQPTPSFFKESQMKLLVLLAAIFVTGCSVEVAQETESRSQNELSSTFDKSKTTVAVGILEAPETSPETKHTAQESATSSSDRSQTTVNVIVPESPPKVIMAPLPPVPHNRRFEWQATETS